MKIFYINNRDNGATYHFYNKNGKELMLLGDILQDAYSYTIDGKPEFDKFYAYATIGDDVFVVKNLSWGFKEIQTHANDDAMGSGKKNTSRVISLNFIDGKKETIFKWIETLNKHEHEGHNDWYIPSLYEARYLFRKTDIPCEKIWTSVEYGDDYRCAVTWIPEENASGWSNKTQAASWLGCIPIRSF